MSDTNKEKDEYPLYPELSEAGKEEAAKLVKDFKDQLVKAAEEAIENLHVDIIPHIESDSWTNFRNDLMDGFRNYENRLVQGEYNFKDIRQAILKHHREDIIDDLNQDNLDKIKELEDQIERMNQFQRGY